MPAVREMMTHNKEGLLVKPGNVDALAKKLIEALKNQDKFAPLRKNARQRILDSYDQKTIFPERLAMIEDLVSRKQAYGKPHRSLIGDNQFPE